LMPFRRLAGKGSTALVRRSGFRWDLDLNQSEGISIYLTGTFQRDSVLVMRKLIQPGDVVLDIGAHFGSQTMFAARAAGPRGRVYTFEPTGYAYRALLKNISLNPEYSSRIVAEQMYVASGAAAAVPAQVYSNWPLVTGEPVHEHHRGILESIDGAFVESIDGYCRSRGIDTVRVMKIDVDGFECEVLRGARETLRRSRPPILIELEPSLYDRPGGDRFEDLLDLLAQARYRLVHSTKGTPLPMDGSLRKLIPDGASMDALALPCD